MNLANQKLVLLDSEDLSSSAASFENTAFYWGKSIFTTGLIREGKLSFYSAHEERLEKAALWLFGQEPGVSLEDVLKPLTEKTILKKERSKDYKIRVTFFENMEGRMHHLLEVSAFESVKRSSCSAELVTCPSLSVSRPAFVKLGSYAETLRVRRNSENEPLFYDLENNIMEGAVANTILFHREKREWVTPRSRFTIVEGLGLKVGLSDLKVVSDFINKDNVDQFSAAFFVNSLRGLTPITSVDGHTFRDNENYYNILQSKFDRSCYDTSRVLWQVEK